MRGRVEPSVRHVVAVVPAYLAILAQVEPMARCLVSLWATAPGIQAIVIDDASPQTAYVHQLAAAWRGTRPSCARRRRRPAAAIEVRLRLWATTTEGTYERARCAAGGRTNPRPVIGHRSRALKRGTLQPCRIPRPRSCASSRSSASAASENRR